MADRLVHGLPESAVPLLADAAETITFADGKSAVRFLLRSGKDIADFLGHVTRGVYGPERLAITNGIALRLPVSDRQSILQSIGIPRILAVGTAEQAGKETFIWW
jgi:hypothetical protein